MGILEKAEKTNFDYVCKVACLIKQRILFDKLLGLIAENTHDFEPPSSFKMGVG